MTPYLWSDWEHKLVSKQKDKYSTYVGFADRIKMYLLDQWRWQIAHGQLRHRHSEDDQIVQCMMSYKPWTPQMLFKQPFPS